VASDTEHEQHVIVSSAQCGTQRGVGLAYPVWEALHTGFDAEHPIPQLRPGIHFQVTLHATLDSPWYLWWRR